MQDLLLRYATRTPHKPFLFTEKNSISYGKAAEVVGKAAEAFRKLGVRRHDRVLIFAPNSIQYVLALFATFSLGAIAALVDVLDPETYQRNVKRITPRIVVSISSRLDSLKEWTPARTKFVSLDGGKQFASPWQTLVQGSTKFGGVKVEDRDPCHLSFSSGTTYQPKPIVLSHEPTVRACRCIAERLGLGPDDTTIGITTLSSSHILVYGILPQMFRGATTGVLESWDACAAWKIIRTKKVRMISGTAIRLSELVDYAIEKNFESGSLRLVLSGGSAGIGRIREKWEKLGVRFVETYGMSELGGTAAMGFPHPFETKPVSPFLNVGAIGPPPPDKEVLIVNEAGRALDPGTPGKIEIRGGFMSGYWKMPKETAKTTRGGWLRTSDIGYIDELDNVYWLARQTDLIITEMGQVFPRVIEEALFTHPFVRQVSVKGITTLKSQYQTPVGFVTLFAGKSANEKELLDYCKAKLDRKFWPSRIIIRDQFPMTPTGKINKKLLSVD